MPLPACCQICEAFLSSNQPRGRSLAVAMPRDSQPGGYRLIELRDVAVGKDAVYISRDSRDPDTPHIHTKFLEAQTK